MRTCAQMPYHSGIVFRFYPSFRQRRIVAINGGCDRAVYNKLKELNDEAYHIKKTAPFVPCDKERLEYINSILHNTEKGLNSCLKNLMPFLYGEDVDSLTVDNSIKHYKAAWARFRDNPGSGIPQFKKKSYETSYQTNAHYKKDAKCINDGNARFEDVSHLILPILGRVRISGSKKRTLSLMNREDTRIGTITVVRDNIGRYYVSLQLASENPFVDALPKTGAMAGIDLNIENFLWDSDGNVVDNPIFKKTELHQIVMLQRAMSRKVEQAKRDKKKLSDSRNYQKNRRKLALLYSKIAGRWKNFRHVISKRYIENQDYLFAEDLKVKNLLKNHHLAASISECGWSDFLRMLEYKAELYDKVFLKVPPHYTTQTCSSCGHVLSGDDKLTLGDREWICPKCGAYHIRDYNAARNILMKGLIALGMAS